MIRMRTWPHRDGGRVVQVYGKLWQIEICWAPLRRDRWGLNIPFTVTVKRYA